MRLAIILLVLFCFDAAVSKSAVSRYIGCYESANSSSVLERAVDAGNKITLDSCASKCTALPSAYFGVKAGSKCFCGDYLVDAIPATDSHCAWKCRGNLKQNCGSSAKTAVYSVGSQVRGRAIGKVPPPVSTVSKPDFYEGCFSWYNRSNAILRHFGGKNESMSLSVCRQLCSRRSFDYFGLTSGSECYCGSRLYEAVPLSDLKCMQQCKGNPRDFCGTDTAIALYRTGNKTAQPEAPLKAKSGLVSMVGCFLVAPKSQIQGYPVARGSSITQGLCKRVCSAHLARNFGLTGGNMCYCVDSVAGATKSATKNCAAISCTGNSKQSCGGPKAMLVLRPV